MSPLPMPADREFMRRALLLAERGWGRVHPNPLVGAVVVRDGVVVGTGYHAEYGGPHAEAAALAEAGAEARGATLYVTLEPCAHQGKTPPCADAVLTAGITRVVVAAEDPNPSAAGGISRLREAGVQVTTGVEREAARAQNAAFFHAHERDTPFVALKYGLSLDARLGLEAGRATRVTGVESQAEVHRLRAGFDAILVGRGTAAADDPLLTVRGSVAPRVPPVRIVVDSEAVLSPESRLVRTIAEAPVWVVCGNRAPVARREALERAGVRTLAVAEGEGGLRPESLLERLRAEGVRSVFCEGGGRLGAALLRADLVDRLLLFYAPRLFGERGVPAFPGEFGGGGAGWRLREVRVLGNDTLIMLDREA